MTVHPSIWIEQSSAQGRIGIYNFVSLPYTRYRYQTLFTFGAVSTVTAQICSNILLHLELRLLQNILRIARSLNLHQPSQDLALLKLAAYEMMERGRV